VNPPEFRSAQFPCPTEPSPVSCRFYAGASTDGVGTRVEAARSQGRFNLFALDHLFSETSEQGLLRGVDRVLPKLSACMASFGYEYASPRLAWEAATADSELAQVIALADARCREEEGLNATIRKIVLGGAEQLVGRDASTAGHIDGLLGIRGGST
jgi:hypothetical protein